MTVNVPKAPKQPNKMEDLFVEPVDEKAQVAEVLGDQVAQPEKKGKRKAASGASKKPRQAKSVYFKSVGPANYMVCAYTGQLCQEGYVFAGPGTKHSGPFVNIPAAAGWVKQKWLNGSNTQAQTIEFMKQLTAWLKREKLSMEDVNSVAAPSDEILKTDPNLLAWYASFPTAATCELLVDVEPPTHTTEQFQQEYDSKKKERQANAKASGDKPAKRRKQVVINNSDVIIASDSKVIKKSHKQAPVQHDASSDSESDSDMDE